MGEPQSPSELERLDAVIAELERERERRKVADTRPVPTALPVDGETFELAAKRAVTEHLSAHPNAPKAVRDYRWVEFVVLDPPPAIELPAEQYAPDHADAVDVTPPMPRRPPAARAPAPAPPPIEPWSRTTRADRIAENHAAEKRRFERFRDDDWKPGEGMLRYPRGNRNGW